MTAIAVGSVRSAGATTIAMTLAALRSEAVLVEADGDGGVLALRYGLAREPGLLTLAASRQPPAAVLLEHAQRLPGGMPVVLAPESPERASQVLRSAGRRIASLMTEPGERDVIIDIGRLSPSGTGMAIAAAAPLVLIVARPRAEELVAAAERASVIGETARLVLVGTGPYSASDVASQLGCAVAGTVAADPRAARTLADGGSARSLGRSALVRSVRALGLVLEPAPGPAGSRTRDLERAEAPV